MLLDLLPMENDGPHRRPTSIVGNARYQSTPIAKSAMSLYDVGHGINNVQAKLFAKGADTVIPQIVKKMYDAGIQYDFLNFPTIHRNFLLQNLPLKYLIYHLLLRMVKIIHIFYL